ncbi:Alpha/beta-Hydrolases superfamily protein isoform 2 [Hibiscus syriacus]|uniref:Alpha/beta-Hydrolases superfamily protein isoform 2 n=1 Tax=Hibiscus syriacus TaxID=106335 RepID=A0A6A3D5V4_HIBSY|nr:Alpha/beta-Hydrolases superfamily protein isoform 2 [Hibiscus syriacus]
MESYMSLILYGIGGILVAGLALLVAFQEKLVYIPVLPGLTKSYPITPARLRLIYEDVWLRSSDGVRLHSWFIKLFPDCRVGGLFFLLLSLDHWSADIAHRLEMIRVMLQRLQCNVFMLSYRGYGASDGYPSQLGIINDAQAALDHLSQRTDIDTDKIVVFGRSLGGAVGAALTKNNNDKVAALILENTFTSILDMAGVLFPLLKWFLGGPGTKGPKILNFLVRSPWCTIDAIGQVKQPVLFLSGLQDEMIPPSHMQMLYAKAAARNRRCQFVEFPTGMHMDTWLVEGDLYWKTIKQFLEQHLPKKKETESSQNGHDYIQLEHFTAIELCFIPSSFSLYDTHISFSYLQTRNAKSWSFSTSLFGLGSRNQKTFRPKKNAPSGSKVQVLRPLVLSSKGTSMTIDVGRYEYRWADGVTEIMSLKEEAHLNTCFKHFVLFTWEFRLIDNGELAPLSDLVDSILQL